MATVRRRGGKFQVQIRRNDSKPLSRSFFKKSDEMKWARSMEVKIDRGELPQSRKELKLTGSERR
jgi:hypothetical protein